jgi:hypothetical protein
LSTFDQSVIVEAAAAEDTEFVLVVDTEGTLKLWFTAEAPSDIMAMVDSLETAAAHLRIKLENIDMRVH